MDKDALEFLRQLEATVPANEAEVETKIILHIFRLLGYSDLDRSDKPQVTMFFGRERRLKHPDFLLYDGIERSLDNALITVEAKALGEDLEDAESQAKSYAAWAGTPFYLVCNGRTIRAVRFMPGTQEFVRLDIQVGKLSNEWDRLNHFLK